MPKIEPVWKTLTMECNGIPRRGLCPPIAEDISMSTAIAYLTTGEAEGIPPANGAFFTREELQSVVGGGFEVILLPEDQVMVINDEGLVNLPLNRTATSLYRQATGSRAVIHGVALVCTAEQVRSY